MTLAEVDRSARKVVNWQVRGRRPIAILVLFRFDTEDYVTPESNDALLAIAETMNARGVRATFPMVGEKARFLKRERRSDVVKALEPHALGFHTNWHSAHPTLPERAEPLSWEVGLQRLDETEREGVEAVADVFGRHPVAYTQAGGTWLPHHHTLISKWNIPFFYTETWNSYLDVVGIPYRMGETMGLTSPVTVMRVFDLCTEGREAEARAQIDAAIEASNRSGGGMLGFVAHPTELVTIGRFWDILNFGAGENLVPREGPYRKPQLKSRADVNRDLRAFADLLDYLQSRTEVQIMAIDEYEELLQPMATRPDAVPNWGRLAESVAHGSLPLHDGASNYTPLEALQLLGALHLRAAAGERGEIGLAEAQAAAPFSAGPVTGKRVDEHLVAGSGAVDATIDEWQCAWSNLARTERERAILPDTCTVAGRTVWVGTLLSALGQIVHQALSDHPDMDGSDALKHLMRARPTQRFRGEPLDPTVQGIKAVERLHWDWPIFAPDARFDRCYEMTRAQMWTFAPLPDPTVSSLPRGHEAGATPR